MKADDLKLYASTLVAVILSVGAPALLVYVLLQPSVANGGTLDETSKAGISALLGGLSTYGIQFLFGRDIAAGAARATERAMGVSVAQPMPHAFEDELPDEDIDGDGDVDDETPVPLADQPPGR